MSDFDPIRLTWGEYVVVHARRIAAAAVVVCAAIAWLLVVGLPGGTELTGRVTAGGRDVVYGTVTAIAADGRVHSAPIAPDGTYRFRSLPAGPVRLAVSSPRPQSVVDATAVAAAPTAAPGPEPAGPAAGPAAGRRDGAAAAGKQPPADPAVENVTVATTSTAAAPGPLPRQPTAQQRAWFRIPGRYASPSTSGIQGDVRRGRTSLDLRLD